MGVISLRKHAPRHSEDPLDGPRHPRPERLHPAPERRLVLGLHQQVNVILLNAVVDETKIAPLTSLPKAPPQLADEPPAAQPWQPVPHAQGYVHRPAAPKALTPLVPLADPAGTLAPRARPRPTSPTAHAMVIEGLLPGCS